MIFQHQYALTKQDEKNNHENIELAEMKNVNVGEEKTTAEINSKERKDQQKETTKEDLIKWHSTAILNELESNLHQDEINQDSPAILNESKLKLSRVDMNNLKQEPTLMNSFSKTNARSTKKNERLVDIPVVQYNLPQRTTTNNINWNIGAITEYTTEPLLPLAKACAPLVGILHDLSFYVQMVLEETPDEPSDGLTVDESAAIRLYTVEWTEPHRSLYFMLNYTLQNDIREHLRPYFRYMKLLITALVKLPFVPPSTVWRGVNKNVSANFPPGTPVTWWAFTSCTTELTVLENNMYLGDTGERTLFSVEAINGRAVHTHSHFVTEGEVLLLPGTHMIVQSQFSPGADLYIIHLKQVIPEEVLLEPPFEGDLNIFNQLFQTNYISTFRCTSLSKN